MLQNIGDSRAVLSAQCGKKMVVLTNDHKPNDEKEKQRIVENGGKVYQTQTNAKNITGVNSSSNTNNNQILLGPHRVFPGRLSVSRTFGDVEAKLSKFGGMSGVIIAVPEINQFKINSEMDFVILGCDGIYDQLTNREVVDCVWMTMKEAAKSKSLHIQCGMAVDMVLKTSLIRRTLDNVTAVLIAFPCIETYFGNSEIHANTNHLDKNNYKSNQIDAKKNNLSEGNFQNLNNYNSNKENSGSKPKLDDKKNSPQYNSNSNSKPGNSSHNSSRKTTEEFNEKKKTEENIQSSKHNTEKGFSLNSLKK